MSHRPCVIVLSLLFLCSLTNPTQAQENLPKLIKRIQPAVVTVIGYDAHGKVIRLGAAFSLIAMTISLPMAM